MTMVTLSNRVNELDDLSRPGAYFRLQQEVIFPQIVSDLLVYS